jgi:hypothetical protein
MHGTRDVLKKNFMVNWRNELSVSVLPPISVEKVQNTDMPELINSTREMMLAEYEQISSK